MKKLALFSMVLLASMGMVSASNTTENAVNQYNNNLEEVPSAVTGLINGEVVNINFDTDIDEFNVTENSSTVGIKMADNKMKNISEGGYEDPTLDVYIEAEDIDQLKNASDPAKETSKMIRTGQIERESHTIGMKVKTTVVDVGLSVLSFFT